MQRSRSNHIRKSLKQNSNKIRWELRLSPATYNQRLAILSSFYGYAHRQGLLTGENPIGRVERRPVNLYGDASALAYKEVKK